MRWAPRIRLLASSSTTRLVVAVVVAASVVVLAVAHRRELILGINSLAGGEKEWLLPAGLATVSVWIAGAVTQLGSMPIRTPVGQLMAVQVAASFANNVSPVGSGGIGVNIRFLRRQGLGLAAASGSVGLNSLAGLVSHLLLLLAAVAISPRVTYRVRVPISWHRLAMAVAYPAGLILLLFVGFSAVALARRSWRARLIRSAAKVRHELRGLASVLRHPGRAAALWMGSLSTPLLHGVILFAVLRSLGSTMTVGAAVVVYLVISSLSALVPSPGGLGALDVMLVTGLHAVGISSPLAFGSVVGYRLITVWLPLLPGAVALVVLVRRRII